MLTVHPTNIQTEEQLGQYVMRIKGSCTSPSDGCNGMRIAAFFRVRPNQFIATLAGFGV